MGMKLAKLVYGCVLFFVINAVQAAQIELYDWVFTIDGVSSEAYFGDPLPGTSNLDASGLGTFSFDFSGAGNHSILAYLDYQFVGPDSTYFDEYGEVHGTIAAGQSWEIDDPFFGDILFNNAFDGTLDDTNAVTQGFENDVAFALGWDFNLAADETAEVTFTVSDLLGTSDFYLAQFDGSTDLNIFSWSTLIITSPSGGQPPTINVPEPETLFLLLGGLLLIMGSISRYRPIDL